MAGALAVFVWLNMSYSMQPYTEHLGAGGWSGGVRYGLPFVCWDSSQDAVARIHPSGKMEIVFANNGGIVWLGLLGNVGIALAVLGSAAWLIETSRRRFLRSSPSSSPKSTRIHRISYAAALCVAAGMLWVNARTEIETIRQDSHVDYKQSMGWPLEAFTASEPAKWEFLRANAKAQPMIQHLRDNPDASYRLGHWHAQNVSINCVIGGMLTILAIMISEILMQRRREEAAQAIPVSNRTSQRLKPQ